MSSHFSDSYSDVEIKLKEENTTIISKTSQKNYIKQAKTSKKTHDIKKSVIESNKKSLLINRFYTSGKRIIQVCLFKNIENTNYIILYLF